ncbi:Suppressor of fused protein (SUFU) [Flexibacter flexilis DSM 6793]|uniref:Suppressor of fused protein (SUFU) n=1 Tax=Flexibacter flexilis DSM 6793 TaxID=927664 RepID=A0A1I1H4U2_9BACT|nr:suppressor of fused domain protein [Flexibacter flexilis]SFC18755.1 Suppressor of fused protein (SUFU) [Flexibacter flexilis DSM 6793]
MNNARAEKFLEYLNEKLGIRAEVLGIETEDGDVILVAQCLNYPNKGFVTAITYGLSEASHPEWDEAGLKPELMLTVPSAQIEWPLAMAHLIEAHRHSNNFAIGSLFDIGGTIHPESEMEGFVVFNSATTKPEDFLNIELGENDRVALFGLYPIYVGEIELLHKIGMRKMFSLPEFQLLSITRPDLSKIYPVGS